jgi:hypothetical protein
MHMIAAGAHRSRALFLLSALLWGMPAVAGTITSVVYATQTGWYENAGSNIVTSQGGSNYFVGGDLIEHRDFFVFNLPNTSNVIDAWITIFNPTSYNSDARPQLNFSVFDVTTPVTTLAAYGGGVSTWDDLGSGISYGSRTYTAFDDGRYTTIQLNSQAIAAIQAHANSGFAIGGAINPWFLDDPSYIFGNSGRGIPSDVQLTLVSVPLPSSVSAGMAILGSLFAARVLRRRNVTAA